MAGKLSFSIAINLLTENFKKGTNQVKSAFRAMQMQILTFTAALGAGGIGLSNLVSRFVDVARETNRVTTALKNASGNMSQYADNQRFLLDMAKKYGLELNALTGNYAKFTAAASISNMSMEEQRKVFESVSRAATAFGMSAEDSNGVFLALSQMMSKGKISSEELRLQMGERLPVALQAMAKAAGTSVKELDKLLKEGKLMSADVLPKFADALNEMIPNVDTNNLETSVNRLKNIFTELVNSMDVQGKYKSLVDWIAGALDSLKSKISGIFAFIITIISGKLLLAVGNYFKKFWTLIDTTVSKAAVAQEQMKIASEKRMKAEITYQKVLDDYNKVSNGKRLASIHQLNKAELELNRAKNAELIAQNNVKAATEAANAVKTSNAWGKALVSIKIGFANLWIAIKGAFLSFAPILLISGIAAFVGKLVNARKEATRIKNIFSDYKKELSDLKSPVEITQLRTLQKLYNEASKDAKLQKQYKEKIESLVGSQIKKEQNINDVIKERIKLLEANATADYLTGKKIEMQEGQREAAKKAGMGTRQLSELVLLKYQDKGEYNRRIDEYHQEGKNVLKIEQAVKEYLQNAKVLSDVNKRLESAVKYISEKEIKTVASGSEEAENTELQKQQERYAQSLRELNARREVEMMTVDDYNKAYAELNKNALIAAMASGDKKVVNSSFTKKLAEEYSKAMRNIVASTSSDILNDIQKELADEEKAVTIEATPVIKRRDTTFDYKKTNVDILKEELDIWEEYKRNLQDAVNNGAEYLQDTLNDAINNVESLDDKLKIAQVRQDIKDLSKELNESLYSGVKDIAGSSDRIVSAFRNLNEVLNDVDASGWEKVMAIWNTMVNTVDTIMSVVKTIENISSLTKKLGEAQKSDESPEKKAAVKIAATAAEVGANKVAAEMEIETSQRKTEAAATEMAAKSTAAYASIPFIGAGLAAAQIAAMTAMIQSAMVKVPKFANGGIITGGPAYGDRILARVNSGEMILNKRQQSRLFDAINSGKLGGGTDLTSTVTTKVRAKDLILAINNELKSQGKKTIS